MRQQPEISRPNLNIAAAVVVTTAKAGTRRLAHGISSEMNTLEFVGETALMLAAYLEGCENVSTVNTR